MTKLLANQSLSIRRESLRKAKEAARKAHPSKMAFVLAAKLLPAIFSWEELSSSRGQGLKSKEGDNRPVLDISKMAILKGRCFNHNFFSVPSLKNITDKR